MAFMSLVVDRTTRSQLRQSSALKMSGNVVLETSMGELTLELYWDHAPRTCNNFFELAKRGCA